MILGVNGIRLVGRRSGVGRCIEAILRCMGELDHPFTEIRVYTPTPVEDVKLPSCARNIVLRSRLPPALWEQWVLPRAHGAKHLLLCPSYVVPLIARCPTLLIHHGSYEAYPRGFSWWTRAKARLAYHLSAKHATLVSTVSHHSERDILRFYGIAPEKVHVIPEGVDTHLFRPMAEQERLADWRRETLGGDIPFFLYVGKPVMRRNVPNLIRAFGRLKRDRGLPHKLLLVGTALPGVTLSPVIRHMQLDNDVVCIGYMSQEELVLAYNASEMLVYPSSFEGFGMPVLEAMACGVPVITLNNTAFPEFAARIAYLLEDAEVTTLKTAMARLLEDKAWREHALRAGPRRAADYDWRLITKQYLALMTRLAAA